MLCVNRGRIHLGNRWGVSVQGPWGRFVPFFYYVGPGDWAQFIRFGGRLLTHWAIYVAHINSFLKKDKVVRNLETKMPVSAFQNQLGRIHLEL